VRLGLREANQRFSKAIRAVRAGREVVLTERGHPIAVIKPIKDNDVQEASFRAMVGAHPIRTLDAIHVASAQLFAARLSIPGLTFVSADKRQTETAVAVGLAARIV
jgi:prevent-host-death family protein